MEMETNTTFRIQIQTRPLPSLTKLIDNLKSIGTENQTLNKVQKAKIKDLLKIIKEEIKNRNNKKK